MTCPVGGRCWVCVGEKQGMENDVLKRALQRDLRCVKPLNTLQPKKRELGAEVIMIHCCGLSEENCWLEA